MTRSRLRNNPSLARLRVNRTTTTLEEDQCKDVNNVCNAKRNYPNCSRLSDEARQALECLRYRAIRVQLDARSEN